MAALLMQGVVVSRGKRRKSHGEKEGKKREDEKDDREERGIRKGGKERWWCVMCVLLPRIKRAGQLAED